MIDGRTVIRSIIYLDLVRTDMELALLLFAAVPYTEKGRGSGGTWPADWRAAPWHAAARRRGPRG
jgi:hypothetical protein